MAARAGEKAERLRDGDAEPGGRAMPAAFDGFTRALALPATTSERARAARARQGRCARRGAAVQLELLAQLAQVADLSLEIAEQGLASAVGDAATAAFLAVGARAERVLVGAEQSGGGGWRTWPTGSGVGAATTLLERVEDAERRVRHLLEARVPLRHQAAVRIRGPFRR